MKRLLLSLVLLFACCEKPGKVTYISESEIPGVGIFRLLSYFYWIYF